MARIRVKGYDLYKYREVWEVLERREGAIYKTRSTGKFISEDKEAELDTQKYVTAPCSTRLMMQEEVELNLFSI